ncbi:hypothetical protein U1839_12825, partial [Sphingomonas sp. RT2P30]|uniref:hypothetical protein n=1 Tax=Parasphingomonas halimpatiens TaxID=3096162 RepID=UPI002FC74368
SRVIVIPDISASNPTLPHRIRKSTSWESPQSQSFRPLVLLEDARTFNIAHIMRKLRMRDGN